MIIALVVFLTGLSAGLFIVSLLDPQKRLFKEEAIAISLVVGMVIVLIVSVVFSLFTGSVYFGALLVFVLVLIGSFLWYNRIKSYFLSVRLSNYFSFGIICIAIVFFIVYGILLLQILNQHNGNLVSDMISWGDTAYHLSLIETLTSQSRFTLFEPNLAFEPLNYPFLMDYFSIMMRSFKNGVVDSFQYPAFIFSFLLVAVLYMVGMRLFQKKYLAVILVFAVLMGGGLGFLYFFKDVASSWSQGGLRAAVSTVENHPYWYTHADNHTGGKVAEKDSTRNISWIVPIISFFTHQRSLILGFVLFLVMFLGMIVYFGEPSVMWRWVVLSGLLALAHFNTLIGLGAIFISFIVIDLFDLKRMKMWIIGGVLALTVLLLQLLFITHFSSVFSQSSSLIQPHFGWLMCTHQNSWFFCDPNEVGRDSNFIWFELKNFGVVFAAWIAVIVAYIFKRKSFENMLLLPYFIFASIFIFVITNIFKFQPWEFDNNKVILYWWFLAICISLFGIKKLSEKYPRASILVVLIFAFGVLASGVLDVQQRLVWGSTESATYVDAASQEIANWFKDNSKPEEVVFGNDSETIFIPAIAGRPVFIGYEGWITTHGLSAELNKRHEIISSGTLCPYVSYIYKTRNFKFSVSDPQHVAFCAPSDKSRCIIKLDCAYSK